MGKREEAMLDFGAYHCPNWCVRPDDEHDYEEHFSEWVHLALADRHGIDVGTVRVRARRSWFDLDNEEPDGDVELVVLGDVGQPGTLFSVDDGALDALRGLLNDAEDLVMMRKRGCEWVPAYDGAQADYEADQAAEEEEG